MPWSVVSGQWSVIDCKISDIRHPVSGILYPVSGIRDQVQVYIARPMLKIIKERLMKWRKVKVSDRGG